MKRMFDKEEIVEIAKEEGGSVVVDSELSPTSENPVQNKVIYEALQSGSGKYLHIITLDVKGAYTNYLHLRALDFIVNDAPTPFTTQSYHTYLYDNNYRTDGTSRNVCSNSVSSIIDSRLSTISLKGIYVISASQGTEYITFFKEAITGSISDTTVNFSISRTIGSNIGVSFDVIDEVIEL